MIAQQIAKSNIQNTTFLTIELETDHNKLNPFILKPKSRSRQQSNPFFDKNTDSTDLSGSNPTTPKSYCLTLIEEVDYSSFAPLLHSVVPMFLQQAGINPQMISLQSEMTDRSTSIKDWILNNNSNLLILDTDALELGRVISNILQNCKTLLPSILRPACQSLLAVNQASDSSRKIKGSALNIPSQSIKLMIT